MSSMLCCRQPCCSLLGCGDEAPGATELLGVGWAGVRMGSEGTACSPPAQCFGCLPAQPMLGNVLPGVWLMFCCLFLQVFSFKFFCLHLCKVLRASATCCFSRFAHSFLSRTLRAAVCRLQLELGLLSLYLPTLQCCVGIRDGIPRR